MMYTDEAAKILNCSIGEVARKAQMGLLGTVDREPRRGYRGGKPSLVLNREQVLAYAVNRQRAAFKLSPVERLPRARIKEHEQKKLSPRLEISAAAELSVELVIDDVMAALLPLMRVAARRALREALEDV